MRRVGPWLLALFLTAGAFKAASFLSALPDLTLLLAAGVVIVAVHDAASYGIPRALVPFLWLLAAFTLGVPAAAGGSYGSTKLAGIFVLLPVTTFGAVCILRRADDRARFYRALALIGVGLSVAGILTPSESTYGRYVASGTPILLARASGMTLLLSLVYVMASHGGRRLRWLVAAGVAMVAFVGAGEKGPVLGAAAAGIALLILGTRRGRLRIVMVFALAAVLAWVALSIAPKSSLARFTAYNGRAAQLQERRLAYTATWHAIPHHPFGIGWGNWSKLVTVFQPDGKQLRYPHDLTLEVAVEAGWLPVAVMLLVLAAALRRVIRAPVSVERQILLALLIFTVVNASVSGDVNDNRIVFAVVAAAMSLTAPSRYGSDAADGRRLASPVRIRV